MSRRLGKIYMKGGMSPETKAEITKVFGIIGFLPEHAYYISKQDRHRWLGMCPKFRDLDEDERIPIYEVHYDCNLVGEPVSARVEEIK